MPGKGELPAGRGYLVKAVKFNLVQVAAPFVDGTEEGAMERYLDDWVAQIVQRYAGQKPEWNYSGDPQPLRDSLKELDAEDRASRGF